MKIEIVDHPEKDDLVVDHKGNCGKVEVPLNMIALNDFNTPLYQVLLNKIVAHVTTGRELAIVTVKQVRDTEERERFWELLNPELRFKEGGGEEEDDED